MCIPASERPWPCWQTRRGGTTVISIVAAAAFAVAAHAAQSLKRTLQRKAFEAVRGC